MDKQPAVYILASRRNGTLYIGVTSDLVKRIWEHQNDIEEGFTKRYGVHYLVWYELHENMASAIERERQLKEWKRKWKWKLELIESVNPSWQVYTLPLFDWIPASAGMTAYAMNCRSGNPTCRCHHARPRYPVQ